MALLPAVLILALVQGLTEFLPVSSSGHLVVMQRLLRFPEAPLFWGIVLHLGTLAAVCIYFARDLKSLALRPLQQDNRRLIVMIALASIPTALAGVLFKTRFERLFSAPRATGFAFLVTAALLLLAKRFRFRPVNPYLAALIVGIFQGLAIAPGISRSGATIAAGVMLGLGFDFSFRFSFLLSIPAILGATLLEWRGAPPLEGSLLPYTAGFLVAATVGLLALALLKKIILKDRFHWFGFYCLAVGIAVIILM